MRLQRQAVPARFSPLPALGQAARGQPCAAARCSISRPADPLRLRRESAPTAALAASARSRRRPGARRAHPGGPLPRRRTAAGAFPARRCQLCRVRARSHGSWSCAGRPRMDRRRERAPPCAASGTPSSRRLGSETSHAARAVPPPRPRRPGAAPGTGRTRGRAAAPPAPTRAPAPAERSASLPAPRQSRRARPPAVRGARSGRRGSRTCRARCRASRARPEPSSHGRTSHRPGGPENAPQSPDCDAHVVDGFGISADADSRIVSQQLLKLLRT